MSNVRLLELRCTYKWGGGPDKTILLSAERHDRTRVTATLAYIRAAGDREFRIAAKAQARGLNVHEIEEHRRFDWRAIQRIRNLVLAHDINLIHAHDYKSNLLAYIVRQLLRRKRISLLSTAHAWVIIGTRGELYRRLDLLLMRYFDHLIAVSHATKAEMVAAKVPAGKITVIHNGIDTEAWSCARVRMDLREELNLTGDFPIIGYVGRIMPEKDLETWIRTAANITAGYPRTRLVLIGEGRNTTTQEQLLRLASSLGIADRVIFTGYREDLQQAYASFDIFLLTSRREGLPNSILEAMAMGLPVVTTDVAGAKELVSDGTTGFVLPQGDVPGLSQAILRLVADEQLRVSMGRAGRERVEREFSFTRRLQRIEDLYETMLRTAPAG